MLLSVEWKVLFVHFSTSDRLGIFKENLLLDIRSLNTFDRPSQALTAQLRKYSEGSRSSFRNSSRSPEALTPLDADGLYTLFGRGRARRARGGTVPKMRAKECLWYIL